MALTSEKKTIHHTDCGMLTFRDDELREAIQEEVGIKPDLPMESFSDLEEDVRQSIRRIQASPSSRMQTMCAVPSSRWRPDSYARSLDLLGSADGAKYEAASS